MLGNRLAQFKIGSTKVVAKLKSNKPTKVKTKFEAIKFLLEIVKFVPGN